MTGPIRGKFKQRHIGRIPPDARGLKQSSCNQGIAGITSGHRKLGERHRISFPSEETNCPHINFGLLTPRTVREQVSVVLNHPGCILCKAVLRSKHTILQKEA